MKKLLLFLPILFLSLVSFTSCSNDEAATKEGKDGSEIIRAMHERYSEKWYEHFTFSQEVNFYGPREEVVSTSTWYEALKIPGRLAIKFDSKDSGGGMLFNDGRQYVFENGEMVQQVDRIHKLLVLGFDVYLQSPDTTINQLESLGFDLSKMYEDTWRSRPVYVVGTDKPDSTVNQFWIDKERLYFVRSLEVNQQGTVQEVQFNKYEELAGGWVAPEVVIYVNGQIRMKEVYSDMKVPEELDDAIFDPETFTETTW